MDGADHLGVVDSLQIHGCDAEVGVAELALDDVERDALAGELERVRVAQLVRAELPGARARGGLVEVVSAPSPEKIMAAGAEGDCIGGTLAACSPAPPRLAGERVAWAENS
jgi:hypothetical protein